MSVLKRIGLESQHVLNNIIMKDWRTRLYIPQSTQDISKLALLAEMQGILTGRLMNSTDITSGAIEASKTLLANLITYIVTAPFLVLGVTKIIFSNEHVIPTTKGIGSSGEILHLLGVKNEQITLNFTTNKYPSVFGMFLREIIAKTLREASLVYIIDEMVGVIPCIMKSYNIGKTAQLTGAIQGALQFTTLKQTGYSLGSSVKSLMKTLYGKPLSLVASITTVVPVGVWLAPLLTSSMIGVLGGVIGTTIDSDTTRYSG